MTKHSCCKFSFIAPYEEMANSARSICQEFSLNGWMIDVGNAEEGLRAALSHVEKGAKVIVSRGSTAKIISSAVDIPVLDIGVSPYDIANGLTQARIFGTHVGVIGFPDSVYGCRELSEPLKLKVTELVIQDYSEIDRIIAYAKEQGVQVVIGGINEVRAAMDAGMSGLVLTTSKSTINAAIFRAMKVVDDIREEEFRTQQLRTILDFSYEGLLASDRNDRIILANKPAQNMLGLQHSSPVEMHIQELLPFLNFAEIRECRNEVISKLHKIGNNYLVLNIRAVFTDSDFAGMVISFQYAKSIENIEAKVRKELRLKGYVANAHFGDIITRDTHMMKLIEQAKKYAQVDSTILIIGQTGTGKELFAQSIHNASRRAEGPFIAINCASIPENLLESELFGYEDGAFTGARKNGKRGIFELANGGTLFLDEIGEIPLKLQANLLRVLQEKQIIRLGGDRIIPVDVRIIAATHRDLKAAIRAGNFRMDLYFRLNVLQLTLPPLNKRKGDIPMLVQHLISEKSAFLGTAPIRLSEECLQSFCEYDWEGNIRELSNVIERLCIIKRGEYVQLEDFREVQNYELPRTASPSHDMMPAKLDDVVRQAIIDTLRATNGHKERTSELLGISTTTLWRKIKEYGIEI